MSHILLRNGFLDSKIIRQEEVKYQLVLPGYAQGKALKATLDLMDHSGSGRTYCTHCFKIVSTGLVCRRILTGMLPTVAGVLDGE